MEPLRAAEPSADAMASDGAEAMAHAYEVETSRLLRSRLAVTMALYLLFLGTLTLFERRLPGRARIDVALAIEILCCVSAVVLVRIPRFARAVRPIAVAATSGLAITMVGYAASIQSAWDAVVIGQVCLMTCLAILLPWGWKAQLAISTVSLTAFALATPYLEPAPSSLYAVVGLLSAATTSSVAAFLVDRYRFEALARTSELSHAYALQREEAEISRVLLHVAQTLGDYIGREDLLEKVNRLAIEALGCDWSSTFAYDDEHDVFRFVSNVGSPEELRTELESIALPPGALPLFDELRNDRLVEIAEPAS